MRTPQGVVMVTINIGKDFSDTPYGRYPSDSDYCGEIFREKHLVPALKNDEEVIVIIDEAEGYGSSFLDEAFGGLVRERHYNAADLHKKLKIKYKDTDYEMYDTLIWKYIDAAKPRLPKC